MDRDTSRREFLVGAAAGLGLGAIVTVVPAHATPQEMQEAVRKIVGSAPVTKGRVKLELPPLSENGNTVPLTVTVESAMTPADHVRAIHVFTELNPQPEVASFRIGPRAGRARVSARIRLAHTQPLTAIAALAAGSFRSAPAPARVT